MCRAMHFETFESRYFRVHVDTPYGVWCLIRKSDDASTFWFVCSEGWEYYQRLKRAFGTSRQLFDSLCVEYPFD